jgi:uncharacterized protein YybS (DUF2232 family)
MSRRGDGLRQHKREPDRTKASGASEVKTRSLVEGALLAGVTVVLALLGFYVPVLGLIIVFLWPVPIALIHIRHGLRTSILTVVVAGLVLTTFVGPVEALVMSASFGLVGLAFGISFEKKFSAGKTVMIGAIALLLSFAISIGISAAFLDFSLGEMETQLREAFEGATEVYRRLGLNDENIAEAKKYWDTILSTFRIIFPAAFAGAGIFNAFLNFEVSRLVLRRLGYVIDPLPPFDSWRIPRWTVFVYAAGLLAMSLEQYHGMRWLTLVGSNVFMFINMVFLVGGLSLAFHLISRYNIPKGMKGMTVVGVFLVPALQQLVVVAGLADTIVDFRSLEA